MLLSLFEKRIARNSREGSWVIFHKLYAQSESKTRDYRCFGQNFQNFCLLRIKVIKKFKQPAKPIFFEIIQFL